MPFGEPFAPLSNSAICSGDNPMNGFGKLSEIVGSGGNKGPFGTMAGPKVGGGGMKLGSSGMPVNG